MKYPTRTPYWHRWISIFTRAFFWFSMGLLGSALLIVTIVHIGTWLIATGQEDALVVFLLSIPCAILAALYATVEAGNKP
jgi:hypothetical protein